MLKKLLPINEQSLLLSALLMAEKNLLEILSFLPDHSRFRLKIAQEKFLSLPKNERLTQIILELRRLLLIDEFSIDWIHQSWIEHAFSKEPDYLRPIITEAIEYRTKRKTKNPSLSLVYSCFIKQFDVHYQIAIHDPVLMSLQSLKADQESYFINIGRFLAQKDCFEVGLKNLLDCEIEFGLYGCAVYLSAQKYSWQQRIILSLPLKLGQRIKEFIELTDKNEIQLNEHIRHLLVLAIDQKGS